MSSPDEDDIFNLLQEEDLKILKELENANEDYEKIMAIMVRRIALYRSYTKRTLNATKVEIILTQENMIKMQMGILQARHELQTDIANLTSRVDDLESKR